mmetsp:Transcript_15401/g.24645  ORF Transcript_15401/g.24645 Transcript_15401/m.24645 type:complete len:322 (+) Transcript_15401:182-1147(+)
MKLGNKNVVKNTTTEATYLLMDSKDEDGGMANHEKRMKMIGRGRREGGRLSAAEVLGSMEKVSLHKINYSAVAWTFSKVFVGCLLFLLTRWSLRQLGYLGSIPLPSITAFMAGIYFVLSMILKGVLDEYSESSRLPLLVANGVIQYRESWQLCEPRSETVREVTALLAHMVQCLIDGISHPRSGITTINQVLDTFEKLHDYHVSKVLTNDDLNPSISIHLGKQIAHIRILILRADHVARSSYLPISFSLSWLIVSSTTAVLLAVEHSTWEQEYILLPCLVMFIYLFVLFASEMDVSISYTFIHSSANIKLFAAACCKCLST